MKKPLTSQTIAAIIFDPVATQPPPLLSALFRSRATTPASPHYRSYDDAFATLKAMGMSEQAAISVRNELDGLLNAALRDYERISGGAFTRTNVCMDCGDAPLGVRIKGKDDCLQQLMPALCKKVCNDFMEFLPYWLHQSGCSNTAGLQLVSA